MTGKRTDRDPTLAIPWAKNGPPPKPPAPRRRHTSRYDKDEPSILERRFVYFMIAGPEGVRGHTIAAAKRAGYTGKHLPITVSKILQRPRVKALFHRWSDVLDFSAERALKELTAVAYTPITEIVEWDEVGGVKVKPSKSLDPITAAAIQEITEESKTRTVMGAGGEPVDETTRRLTVKMHTKMPALQLLARYAKLVDDRPQVNVWNVLVQQLNLDDLSDEEVRTLQKLAERSTARGPKALQVGTPASDAVTVEVLAGRGAPMEAES